MTSIAEYERWAFGEGWAAGLREGRRLGFEEGYGPGFDAGAETAGRERAAPNDEPCPYGCRSRRVRARRRSIQSGRPR